MVCPTRRNARPALSVLTPFGMGDSLLHVEGLSPTCQVFWGEVVDIAEISFPGRRIAPSQGGLYGRTRAGSTFQEAQCQFERVTLRCDVKGLPRRVAKRQIAEQKTRHTAVFHDVFGTPHDHRWDAVRFQVSSDQTHGLVAHRSIRHEQGNVCLVFLTAAQNLWAILLHGHALAAVRGGAVKALRQSTKATSGHGLL